MEIKRFDSLLCKYEPEKVLWKCKMDNMERKFDDIILKGDRSIELSPFEGNAELFTTNTYCSLTKKPLYTGEETPILWCDTDRERLERGRGWMKHGGFEEW